MVKALNVVTNAGGKGRNRKSEKAIGKPAPVTIKTILHRSQIRQLAQDFKRIKLKRTRMSHDYLPSLRIYLERCATLRNPHRR